MPKLELIIQMISKRLLMPNGILFMRNLTQSFNLALRLFFLCFLLEIQPPNISPTEVFSAQVEFKKMISLEQPKQLVLFCKPQHTESRKIFLVLAENSKRFNLETRDITCSLNVKKPNHPLSFLEVVLLNTLRRPKDHLMTPS